MEIPRTNNSCQQSYQPEQRYQTFNQLSSHRFEYYSFNQGEQSIGRQISHPDSSQSCCNSSQPAPTSFHRLTNKYESLNYQLKQLPPSELLGLLLEQIQQNSTNRTNSSKLSRQLLWYQQQVNQLQKTLKEKREAIGKLVETESRNLDLIETMELKMRGFDLEGHYYKKYTELERHMGDYISSTNQAQEQFLAQISLLRNQNQRLTTQHHQSSHQLFQLTKQHQIITKKCQNFSNNINNLREEQDQAREAIGELRQQNQFLKKDIEALMDTLKGQEQFEIEYSKDNRQISSSLDLLRQRLNNNVSWSREGDRDREKGQFSSRTEEIQNLKIRIGQLTEERELAVLDHDQMFENYRKLNLRFQQISKDNQKLLAIVEQNNSYIDSLKGSALKHQQSQKQIKEKENKMTVDQNKYGENVNLSPGDSLQGIQNLPRSTMSQLTKNTSKQTTSRAFSRFQTKQSRQQ